LRGKQDGLLAGAANDPESRRGGRVPAGAGPGRVALQGGIGKAVVGDDLPDRVTLAFCPGSAGCGS